LSFLGRLDHQVKVRGFRIELGEIEAAIRRFEGVREAVVSAFERAPGDVRLVAHVVPAEASALSVSALRQHLQKGLPAYMIPGNFAELDALPLTANNKIDRRALPAPDMAASGSAYVPPSTAMEEELTKIWESLLGVSPVGIRDNFFEIGGHSLLLVNMHRE